MSLGERIVSALGGVTQSQLNSAVSRAYESGYSDGGEDEPVSGTLKTYGYQRQLTSGLRDFTRIDHDKLLSIVWSLYQSNPVAKRALQIVVGYILGSGVQYHTDDEQLQEILANFWSKNRLDLRLEKFVLQLSLWGEQILPVFVRESDGAVRLGYIDPAQVERIVTHPDNSMEPWAVVLRSDGQTQRVYRVIREEENADSPHHDLLVTAAQAVLEDWETALLQDCGMDRYTGSCFLFQVNNVSNQPRGFSDLVQVADWLDQHDETLFALADREQMAGYFSWDVTLTDADTDLISKRSKELRAAPPKKGSVNVHNEKEKWQFNYPDLKQSASIESADALLTFVLGGLGLPRHWYGHGDETNRATAQAQGDPTWRTLRQRQSYVRFMLEMILSFARDQAQIAGTFRLRDRVAIVVVMPEMTTKDMGAIATAMNQIAAALLIAQQQEWISGDTAQQAWSKVMGELSVEMNPKDEKAAIEEEKLSATGETNQELVSVLKEALLPWQIVRQ